MTVIRGLVSNVTCVVDIECFWIVAPPCSRVELRVRCGHVAVSPGLIKPDRCVKWDVKQHSKIERAGAFRRGTKNHKQTWVGSGGRWDIPLDNQEASSNLVWRPCSRLCVSRILRQFCCGTTLQLAQCGLMSVMTSSMWRMSACIG